MTNKTVTKRALTTSALAILTCIAMLIGSTFAWFTDTASTAVNKIVSGTLKVGLQYAIDWDENGNPTAWDDAAGKTLNFRTADGRTANILWEPGCRYELPQLRVVNDGKLALKYTLVISGINGSAKLNEVIDWTVNGTPIAETEKHLGVGATSEALTIRGEMQTTADNDYQNLTIDGIGITVYAMQDTVETDSFDHLYDEKATYLNTDADGNILIGSAGELSYFALTMNRDAAQYANKTVKLTKDIDLKNALFTPIKAEKITFDGQGHTISNLTVKTDLAAGLFAYATSSTIKNLTIDGADVTGVNHVAALAGDALCTTIENCTVKNATVVTLVKDGDNGDKAGAIAGYLSAEPNAAVVNCSVENCTVRGYRDIGGLIGMANTPSASSVVTVTGNTIKNTTVLGDQTENYKGYTTDAAFDVGAVIGDFAGTLNASNTAEDVTVQYIKPADSQQQLEEALASGTKNFVLGEGEYMLYEKNKNQTQNTTLTLQGKGVDNTTFKVGKPVPDKPGEGNADFSYEGSDVTFKDMTVNMGKKDYMGIVRANSLYFENCKLVGRGSYWGNGKVVFKNCTFENENDYVITTYAGVDFIFENCTFRSTAGKFVNAYKEQRVDSTLTFIGCTFETERPNKAAVCLKSYTGMQWDLRFENCDVSACRADGDANDLKTESKYYSVRSSDNNGVCPTGTKVTIDGTVVWENGAKK